MSSGNLTGTLKEEGVWPPAPQQTPYEEATSKGTRVATAPPAGRAGRKTPGALPCQF